MVTRLPILVLLIILIDKEIYTIHYPRVSLTLSIQALSVMVLIIGLRQTGISSFIGLRQLSRPNGISSTRLVSDGLYRYVRHPLYTAGLVFIWLLPSLTWNLLAMNLGLAAYFFIRAYIEERKLLLEFGDSYAEYRERTSRLILGLKLPHHNRKP